MGLTCRLLLVVAIAMAADAAMAACAVSNNFVTGNVAEADDVDQNFDELKTCIEALQAGTGVTALDVDLITGDSSDDDDLDVAAGGTGVSTLTDGGVLLGNGTGDVVATAVLTEGQLLIGDGTTDPAVAAMSGDVTMGSNGVAAIQANSVALGTDTTGNYAGSSSEGGAATTATALAANGGNCSAGSYPLGVDASGAAESCTDATTEIDAAVAAKSAASSTDNQIVRHDGTGGDVQGSACTLSDAGALDCNGTGGTCFILRDSDDAGDSACEVLNGTFSCEVDTNGVCGDAT